ncbi:MAG: hypothetical protein AAF433_13090 [Bacteroidota bacterium]
MGIYFLQFDLDSFRFPAWWYLLAVTALISGPTQLVVSIIQCHRYQLPILWVHIVLSLVYLLFFALAITDSIPYFEYGYHVLFGCPVVLSWLLTYIEFRIIPSKSIKDTPYFEDILDS